MGKVTMIAGKGGVGKTTCAGACALHYADRGQRTLIISTDPTPSLSHLFEINSEKKPTQVSDHLFIDEIGVGEIKEMWKEKFGQRMYEVFSSFVEISYEEFTDHITTILPGLRDEFMIDYVMELGRGTGYDRVIWDSAPLGQTLGLLETPAMFIEHLKPAVQIYSRWKYTESRKTVQQEIEDWRKLSKEAMDFLREEVRFILVTIPEALAVWQLETVFPEFEKYGLQFDSLIINNVIEEVDSPFLKSRAREQRDYIKLLHHKCQEMKIIELPLFPYEIKGLDRLKGIENSLFKENEAI